VPTWVTRRWVAALSAEHPTLAYHASMTKPFGKGALIALLRQFSKLHADKKNISVGFIGFPNVGKSSIINSLAGKKVCTVAPIPGETKVWQYVTLMKRVFLIDCPGVVPPNGNESEASIVLKGVVRAEKLEAPDEFMPAVFERVKPAHITAVYGVRSWTDTGDFLAQVAVRQGRVLKGGEPDVNTIARNVLFDWQPDEAVKLWRTSAAIDPSFAIVHRNLAIANSHRKCASRDRASRRPILRIHSRNIDPSTSVLTKIALLMAARFRASSRNADRGIVATSARVSV